MINDFHVVNIQLLFLVSQNSICIRLCMRMLTCVSFKINFIFIYKIVIINCNIFGFIYILIIFLTVFVQLKKKISIENVPIFLN